MNETRKSAAPPPGALAVDAAGLAAMLGCGRQTAIKIGTAAGARMTVGRRVLFYLPAVNGYLKDATGGRSAGTLGA